MTTGAVLAAGKGLTRVRLTRVRESLAGFSACTSAAGLSSRRPLNAAWRTMPEPVQPANSISATSRGSTHRTPGSEAGAAAPLNGLAAALTARRRGSSARTAR